MRKRFALIALALVVVDVVPVFVQPVPATAARRSKPNIVILMSDDQRWDKVTAKYMPTVHRRLIRSNPWAFSNAFVPNPLCCPSRVSTLTGRYSHGTGVWANNGPHGGYPAFHDKRTIAVDFDRAGYRTAMIGKYLNGYPAGRVLRTPPGWDTWFAVNTGAYYRYAATANGTRRFFDGRQRDYVTRVLDRRARRFVQHSKRDGKPFFLYYSFTAPHAPAIPDPRDVGRFAGDRDVGKGKSSALESAYGVDRAVRHLLQTLPANTIVVYMSDNGMLWGEHGHGGKQWPYEESIRIPLVFRSLNGRYRLKAATSDMVLNVDLRATLTAAAGVRRTSKTHGKNLFARGYARRAAFPLEHLHDPVISGPPSYCGVRERKWKWVRFANGKVWFFHVAVDHRELHRLSKRAAPQVFHRLKIEARRLCNPPPPGYHWG